MRVIVGLAALATICTVVFGPELVIPKCKSGPRPAAHGPCVR